MKNKPFFLSVIAFLFVIAISRGQAIQNATSNCTLSYTVDYGSCHSGFSGTLSPNSAWSAPTSPPIACDNVTTISDGTNIYSFSSINGPSTGCITLCGVSRHFTFDGKNLSVEDVCP